MNDDEVRLRVLNTLATRQIPGVELLHIEVMKGVVQLQGWLPSLYEKAKCLECCRYIEGVTRLEDQILIERSSASDFWPRTSPRLEFLVRE